MQQMTTARNDGLGENNSHPDFSDYDMLSVDEDADGNLGASSNRSRKQANYV